MSLRSSGVPPPPSLRHGHQLEDVAVGVLEVHAAAAVPVVELAVIRVEGRTAVAQACRFDPAEDGLERAVVDMEREMMGVETGRLIEQQCERVVDVDRREMPRGVLEGQAEDTGKETRRRFLVVRRYDGVIEGDGHRLSPGLTAWNWQPGAAQSRM